jgi:glycosyltransferase 2 family protein
MIMPKKVKTLLKLIFSLIIILYLFSRAPFDQILLALRNVRGSFIASAMFLYLLAQVLSSYKWSLLTQPLGFKKNFIDLVSYYFIGMFFNLFMVGSIGGDLIKTYYLAGKSKRIIPAGYSIFTDRYTGGLALITILSTALLITYQNNAIPFFIRYPIIVGTIVVWVVTLFMPNILRRFPLIKKWGEKIHLQKMQVFWNYPQVVRIPLFISFVFQTLFISIIILVGRGFGIKIPVSYFFIFVPLADILSVLPITLNGMGIREGCYVFFLNLGGVDTSTALAFSLLCLVVVWSVSLLGGVVYLLGDFEVKVKDHLSAQPIEDVEVKSSSN